jgi:hypothetical protein
MMPTVMPIWRDFVRQPEPPHALNPEKFGEEEEANLEREYSFTGVIRCRRD